MAATWPMTTDSAIAEAKSFILRRKRRGVVVVRGSAEYRGFHLAYIPFYCDFLIDGNGVEGTTRSREYSNDKFRQLVFDRGAVEPLCVDGG